MLMYPLEDKWEIRRSICSGSYVLHITQEQVTAWILPGSVHQQTSGFGSGPYPDVRRDTLCTRLPHASES